jgi:hypothetical protein
MGDSQERNWNLLSIAEVVCHFANETVQQGDIYLVQSGENLIFTACSIFLGFEVNLQIGFILSQEIQNVHTF